MDIRERLNQIDHKCLDEDLKFLDLRSLYEASKLSYEDKKEIEKVLRDTDDPETIAAVITAKSKKNEGYEECEDEMSDVDEYEVLTESGYENVISDLESIEKFLNNNNFNSYDVYGYDNYPLETSKIDFEVSGDWRHEHLLFKDLIQKWADKNNRKIFKIDSKEIGDSDSDYYTAIHSVFIAKDDKSFDTLTSMRGLFDESVNKELKENTINKSLNESSTTPSFSAFITNLGKYNEGELVGKWVEFPIDEDDFEEVLTSIGIGSEDEFGTPYEEWFVTDYECNVPGFNWQELGEYPSYETLQEYGEKIESIDDIEAVSNALEATGNLDDAINGLENGEIMYIPGISSDSDLAYYYVDNIYGGVENLDTNTLETYFDYEALGRDLGFDTYEDGVEEVSAGEYWCGDENASDEEIGYAYVDAVGISGVANSGNYFDYEAFGRDLSDDYTFTSDGVVLTESVLNESIGADLSDIPLVDRITFINKKKSMMPGIYNENELVNVLNKVGKNKFKVRTTTFGSNVSDADIKDSWMDLNRKGWSIIKAIDNSLNGFNEVYVCTKQIDEDLKEGTYNDRVKFLPKDKLLKIIDVQKNMKSVDWEDDPDSEYYEKNYKNEIDDYNIRRYGFTW